MSCNCVTDYKSWYRRMTHDYMIPLTGNMCWGLAHAHIKNRYISEFASAPFTKVIIRSTPDAWGQPSTYIPGVNVPTELFVSKYSKSENHMNIPCEKTDEPIMIDNNPIAVFAYPSDQIVCGLSSYYPYCKGRCTFSKERNRDAVANRLSLITFRTTTIGYNAKLAARTIIQMEHRRLLIVWAKRKGYGRLAKLPMDIIRLLCDLLRSNIDWAHAVEN